MTPGAGSLLAPWTLKFARSCTDAHVDHCAPALKELLDTSINIIEGLTETTDLTRTNLPQWYVYTSDSAEADAEQVRTRKTRDEARLASGQGSAKDLEHLQHELVSLTRRVK